MENILESSRKLFIEKNKGKIASIYNNLAKSSNYFEQSSSLEELYYFLKYLRDASSILKLNDLFNIVSHLLKAFKVNGLRYELVDDKKEILLEGIRLLVKYFLNELEENYNEVNSTIKINVESFDKEKFKLLIIDNDEPFIEWLRTSLSGTEFYLYINCLDNLKGFLLKENIDLVIINTLHPQSLKLIEDIKSHTWTAHIPIFAITHTKDEIEQSKIFKLNVDDILVKPISISLFLAKLRNFFNRSKILKTSKLLSWKTQNIEMSELLKKEWVRFQRFNSYYSILIVKLDMYRSLIDVYGHDRVFEYLTLLYEEIKNTIRTYDEIRLWNNDSLLVLLPATRVDGATMVAKRLRVLATKLDSSFLAKYILIGTIESDHEYQGALGMVRKLERELIVTSSDLYVARAIDNNEATKQDKRKKVLLVDDDSATLTILGNHLNSDEWIIEELTEGTKALEKALEIKPDIIIAETRSKNFDGYDFCYQVRQFPVLQDTVFIFLSKLTLNKAIVRGIKMGADDYITKPFSPEEVEIRMIRHLSNLNRKRR